MLGIVVRYTVTLGVAALVVAKAADVASHYWLIVAKVIQ